MLDHGFCTYIVASRRNGTLYTGHTDALMLRATQHREGTFEGFSKQFGCKYLVWFETHDTRDNAFRRERQIKKWERDWKLGLIERFNPNWIDIGLSPMWPLPGREAYPELHARCLEFALGR